MLEVCAEDLGLKIYGFRAQGTTASSQVTQKAKCWTFATP